MLPLSVAIIAHNESARLGQTLSSVVLLASEVIVVDSGSTDATVAIAEEFGARVIRKEFATYTEQRNYALSQCTQGWVLYLNGGDILSSELRVRLQGIISGHDYDYFGHPVTSTSGGGSSAYSIRVESLWFGRVVRFGEHGVREEYRLFHGDAGEFGVGGAGVAGGVGAVEFDGKFTVRDTASVHKIVQPIRNHMSSTMSGYISRINRHTHVKASYLYGQGCHKPSSSTKKWVIAFWEAIRQLTIIPQFVYQFVLSYFIRGGFLNLSSGLPLGIASATAHVMTRLKVYRLHIDNESMYDYPAFEVSSDSADDRAYDDDGKLVVRRLLYARVDKLGDMMITLPALRKLRSMYPDARLDILCSSTNKAIVDELPFIDNVYNIISNANSESEKDKYRSDLISILQGNKYDVLINGQRDNSIIEVLDIPYKVNNKQDPVYPQGISYRHQFKYSNLHEIDYALLLARHTNPKLYSSTGTAEYEMTYPDSHRVAAEAFLSSCGLEPCHRSCRPFLYQPQHGSGFARHEPALDGGDTHSCPPRKNGYIAINIFAGHSSANLSLLMYRNIAVKLTDMGYNVVVIAIPYGVHKHNHTIAERYFAGIAGVHIYTDATSILRMTAIVDGAMVYIGSSTGTTHIANACSVPVVGAWRNNTMEVQNWLPVRVHAFALLFSDKNQNIPRSPELVDVFVNEISAYTHVLMRGLYA